MVTHVLRSLTRCSFQFYREQVHVLGLLPRTEARAFSETHINVCHQNPRAPRILLPSEQVMIDEKVRIKADGLRPGQKVTLFAHMTEAAKVYGSCGHYIANDEGVVDTFEDASRGGTFTGVETMGLFWSMKSKPDGPASRLYKSDVMSPYTVSVKILNGLYNFDDLPWEGSGEQCLASRQLLRSYCKPGVRRVPVEQDGVYGTLFFPPGEGPFPAVIDMFGLTNEWIEFRSALLASHGIASFVLNYVGYKDLPSSMQELDMHYFLKAFDFLSSQPNVDKNALGGIATCTSAAFILFIASKRPMMKCCVSINGVLFPFCSTQEVEEEVIQSAKVDFKDALLIDDKLVLKTLYKPGMEKLTPPGWRHGAKILFIHCLGDKSVDPECLQQLMPLIPDRYKNCVTVLTYPGAGHLLEPPYSPHILSNYNSLFKKVLLWGGDRESHVHAQEDSWPRILEFLHKNLRST